MIIYHCDHCKIEWGWDSNLPPPAALGAEGKMCPSCKQVGVAGPFVDAAHAFDANGRFIGTD